MVSRCPETSGSQIAPQISAICGNMFHRIMDVEEYDPSTSSGQAATQFLSSEQKDERSVATGDEQNYNNW